MQLAVEADVQGQRHVVGPAGQAAFDVGQAQRYMQRLTGVIDLQHFPFARTYQAVGRGGFIAVAHGLHALRVECQVAKPGPAHRHARADAMALLELGFFVEPDDRRLITYLITENLRALFGDQQLGLAMLEVPALQFIQGD